MKQYFIFIDSVVIDAYTLKSILETKVESAAAAQNIRERTVELTALGVLGRACGLLLMEALSLIVFGFVIPDLGCGVASAENPAIRCRRAQ